MTTDVRRLPTEFFKTLTRPGRCADSSGAKQRARPINYGTLLLFAACGYLLCFFAQKFTGAWTEEFEFNGAVWSQAAHNLLAAGLKENLGVPAPFYYDPPPVPPDEYYDHHPALLALTVAGAFAVLGEHEWVARIIPVASSLVSVVLLWLLVKDTAGRKAAGFSALIFAFLPMELIWGQMVNFEPVTLMWVLAGFLGFTRWHATAGSRWRFLMFAGFTLAMLTSWMGYIFTLVVCGWFLAFERKRYARLSFALLAIAVATATIFLLQILLSKAGDLDDLMQAFWFRVGHSTDRHSFTNLEWAGVAGRIFIRYFPWPFLVFAAAGVYASLRAKSAVRHGSAWVAACFFIANAVYDIAFENASYIHDYASFYFIVPVAIMGGMGFAFVYQWLETRLRSPRVANAMIALALVTLGFLGWHSAQLLRHPTHVLTWNDPGPANLIPALGRAIRTELPADATILANFDPEFSPQLCYYAHNKIANGLTTADDWEYFFSITDEKKAGIIWMGSPYAAGIVSQLNPATLHAITVEGIPFCTWKP